MGIGDAPLHLSTATGLIFILSIFGLQVAIGHSWWTVCDEMSSRLSRAPDRLNYNINPELEIYF